MAWVAGNPLQGGKYTIERELGRGRFGITYLVKNKNSDRLVIKTLNDNQLQSLSQSERAQLETMFWQEAVNLTRCQHQHIVQFRTPFKEGDYPCLVMEYVDGVSLADLRPPILSEPEALRYIQQIGEALIVVHKNGLIHRDVHPGNILLRNQEGKLEAVLIDFGLALDFDHILTTSRTKETSDGFTPPELYTKGTITHAYSDIYSLAATLYKLLTGKIPVDAVKRKVDGEHLVSPKDLNLQISDRTNRAILKGIVTGQRPTNSLARKLDDMSLTPPKQINPSISDQLNETILKGMALEAKDRPQSIQEWLAMLQASKATPPPPVESVHRKEVVRPEVKLKSEATSDKPAIKSPRIIPWGWLVGVLFSYLLIACLLSESNAPYIVWALVVAVAMALTWAGFTAMASAWALFMAMAGAWAWTVAWVVAMVGTVTWARAVDWAGFMDWAGLMAWEWSAAWIVAWAVAVAGDKLLKSFSRFDACLILAVTSGVGLGLRWLLR